MVKILYGVCGEGFGHSSRSDAVCSILESMGHQILIAGSKKSYDYHLKQGRKVVKIFGFGFSLKNKKVDVFETVSSNLMDFQGISSVNRLLKICDDFKPDLIITDFEPITAIVAKIKKLPLVSIDHQKLIDSTKIDYPKKYQMDFMTASAVVSGMVNFITKCLVTSFFYPELKDKKVVVIPPIMRNEILLAKPTKKDYTLVYQSYNITKDLLGILKGIKNQNFVVYGQNKNKKLSNVVLKKNSKEGFINDLAGAKAVITNGGYTLMSESLQLEKPVLSVPVEGQFEQVMNAYYLDKLGYGKYYEELDEVKIIGFLHNLEKYETNLKKMKRNGNAILEKKLKAIVKNLKCD